MAKESFFKIKGNKNLVQSLLNDIICDRDDEYDELTLKFSNYFIWVYTYNDESDPNYLHLNIKYSSDISEKDIDIFKEKMLMLGFLQRKI